MVKGMASFVHRLITENKGTFEEEWVCSISEYGVYGKTIKRKMYASDKNDRYFHLYYNSARASSEKREIEAKITEMKRFLMNHKNEKRTFGPAYEKYFILHYDTDGETFLFPEDKTQIVRRQSKKSIGDFDEEIAPVQMNWGIAYFEIEKSLEVNIKPRLHKFFTKN